MKNFGTKSLCVVALMAVATVQTGCNGTQVGAVVGAIAGAAIGGNGHGTGGAIVGGAIGALAGAAIGSIADEDFYDPYYGRHYYRVNSYEVREVRYIPVRPSYYVVRTEYVYVPRYRRSVHVHRWYNGNNCVRQYYVTGVYDGQELNQALESLDPSVEENVARSAKNLGLPEKTTKIILGKGYEAILTKDSAPVVEIFAKEFSAKADREALATAFEHGKLDVAVTDAFVGKVAKSLSKLGGEEITTDMAKSFVEASMKAAAAQ